MTFAELRKSKGFSQAQLAERLGVDQSTVSLWEQGRTAPRVDTAFKLSEILKCSLDEVFCAIRQMSNTKAG